MKQETHTAILNHLNAEAYKNDLTQVEVLKSLCEKFTYDATILKQIHQQYMQNFMMHNAPARYAYLDMKFSKNKEFNLKIEDIKIIINENKGVPVAWLLKNILLKSNFWNKLKKTYKDVKMRNTNGALISQSGQTQISKYGWTHTFDLLAQMKKSETLGNELIEIVKLIVKLSDEDITFGQMAIANAQLEGQTCEKNIAKWLQEQGVSYLPQHELHLHGYDRTPDFLLDVPVIINFKWSGEKEVQSMIIKWIESKSMFGDRETVVKHYKDQLEPYFQRFGAGIVIYFKDCVEEIQKQFSTNSLRILTELPESVTLHSCLQK